MVNCHNNIMKHYGLSMHAHRILYQELATDGRPDAEGGDSDLKWHLALWEREGRGEKEEARGSQSAEPDSKQNCEQNNAQ